MLTCWHVKKAAHEATPRGHATVFGLGPRVSRIPTARRRLIATAACAAARAVSPCGDELAPEACGGVAAADEADRERSMVPAGPACGGLLERPRWIRRIRASWSAMAVAAAR